MSDGQHGPSWLCKQQPGAVRVSEEQLRLCKRREKQEGKKKMRSADGASSVEGENKLWIGVSGFSVEDWVPSEFGIVW